MEESVDLHEEAGKENEQTLANLSPAEEATSKDELGRGWKILKEHNSKNTQYKTKAQCKRRILVEFNSSNLFILK